MDRRSKSSTSSSSSPTHSTPSPGSLKRASFKNNGRMTKEDHDKKDDKTIQTSVPQTSTKSLPSPYSQNPRHFSSKPKPLLKSKSMPASVLHTSLPSPTPPSSQKSLASTSKKSLPPTSSSPTSSLKVSKKSTTKSKHGASGSGGDKSSSVKGGGSIKSKGKSNQNENASTKNKSAGSSSEQSSKEESTPDAPATKEKGNRLLEVVRNHCLGKGDRGIYDLGVLFRHLDVDYNKRIVFEEMRDRLGDYGLRMSDDNVRCLFHHMDEDSSGGIDFLELMSSLRPPMSKIRVAVVYEAFDKLDFNGDGAVDHEEIKAFAAIVTTTCVYSSSVA